MSDHDQLSMEQEDKAREKDFNTCTAGFHIPFVIKMAWTIFFIYVLYYSVKFVYPTFVDWF